MNVAVILFQLARACTIKMKVIPSVGNVRAAIVPLRKEITMSKTAMACKPLQKNAV